jgi:hypothetical protein
MSSDDREMLRKAKIHSTPILERIDRDIWVLQEMKKRLMAPPSSVSSSDVSDVDSDDDADNEREDYERDNDDDYSAASHASEGLSFLDTDVVRCDDFIIM